MCLNISARQLDGAHHQRLEGIRHLVRLVQHVCGIKMRDAAECSIDKFIEDKEQLERFYRTGVEVIISILAVVEMKSTELPELNQPRHNHFNVHVRRMMAKIDKAQGFRPELTRAVIAGS